jgi:hypothetical protein
MIKRMRLMLRAYFLCQATGYALAAIRLIEDSGPDSLGAAQGGVLLAMARLYMTFAEAVCEVANE